MINVAIPRRDNIRLREQSLDSTATVYLVAMNKSTLPRSLKFGRIYLGGNLEGDSLKNSEFTFYMWRAGTKGYGWFLQCVK